MSWTTRGLYEDLLTSNLAADASITLLDTGSNETIELVLKTHGDLPVQINVSGEQVLVSSALWEVSQVKDPAEFNRAALKLNPVNTLSNIGLIDLGEGRELYIMFGELSASSDLRHIVEEIRVLADNTIEAAELFADQLR
ncbi:MAG: YjfI family protein [Xanthomonadales bacterium]|nr:YjfI family protein [Xanthomonadales bacterium]